MKGIEKVTFSKYVNRYVAFCILVGFSYFQTAVAFSFGPIFMTQILPADAWYPFAINVFTLRHIVIYIQQVLAILQTGMCITVDFMVAMLLSYGSTKLELLAMDIKEIRNIKELDECIWKHQDCIR